MLENPNQRDGATPSDPFVDAGTALADLHRSVRAVGVLYGTGAADALDRSIQPLAESLRRALHQRDNLNEDYRQIVNEARSAFATAHRRDEDRTLLAGAVVDVARRLRKKGIDPAVLAAAERILSTNPDLLPDDEVVF